MLSYTTAMQAATHPALERVQQQLTTRLPLLWIALAFLAGILVASWVHLPAAIWLILTAVSILSAILVRRFLPKSEALGLPGALIAVYLTAFFLGAARYQVSQPEITPADIAFYNDRQYDLLVTGWITEMPDRRDRYTNLRVSVESVDSGSGDLPARGLVLARVDENEIYHYGERVRLRSRLQTPPEDEEFSYRDYLARQGILSYMPTARATLLPGNRGNFFWEAMYALKERALARIYQLFPDPEASLLSGILLGVDTGLTREVQNAFKDTGTAHIIAISGFNISIIAAIFVTFFSRWTGRIRGAILAIVAIALYTLLVGADPPVVRAAFMGGLSLFARQVGRRNAGLNGLLAVSLLMAAIDPMIIWDVGFQLSFFATLGILLYAQPLGNLASSLLGRISSPQTADRILPLLSDLVLLTLAAQIATLPIMAYHFQRISLISFLANPFVLPVQPAVMIIGGLSLLAGLLLPALGQWIAWLAWPFVEYTIRAVELFDRLPGGNLYMGRLSPWFLAVFYALLLGLTFNWSRFKEAARSLAARIPNVSLLTIATALFALTLLVWRGAATLPDGDLHITFLDVGSADAILIQTPSGRSVLVNGGPSASELSDDLGRRLPVFNRQIDWLVIASTEENQMAALPRVLDRYPPRNALWSGRVQASYSARQVDVWLAEHRTAVTYAEVGQQLDLGDGATLEVQNQGPRGSVLLVRWRDFRALLPVGMSASSLEDLEYGKKIGPVDVLLLADSGYYGTNNVDWVDNLHPQLAVLSVGAGDPDGLPDRETLDAVTGYPLLRTDRNGWIEVSTNGTEMRVEAEHQ